MSDRDERVDAIRKARRIHQVIANIPFYVVLAIVVVAAILVLMDRWRRGAFVFGSALLVGATFRAILPTVRIGLLQVRSRPFDVAAMAALGAAVLWLATSIDSLGTA
ncbi:DUF3017 domain-containing protein [Gordonia malaquae]|jgi:hypothetical protein|uniref:DUF3017 domain-containing protein n=2 Tax=Gordonia TaxID=2053 RepID=M3UZ92_GORML|nr:DUF3017 domain-containing protein [Gordonia malaquae]GAC81267.1 hypothetical protein GM1_031_00200 [Gordonia malaquae NBRC 108250]SEC18578.1 Protein of unknown function [Gordonia malaquae]